MNYSMLFRHYPYENDDELDIANDIWKDKFHIFRTGVPNDNIVIGRYSVLPFYRELEMELMQKNSYLINNHNQHNFIADMDWYFYLKDLTPNSWFDQGWKSVPDTEFGYVLKGRTNSRKFKWNTHMYASNREDLRNVYMNLLDDPLIGNQGIVIREYIPLEKVGEGINGLNFTNEWRLFFLYGELVDYGFYWTEVEDHPEIENEALDIGKRAANRLADHTNFFVVDVAKTMGGEWIVIEVNDGQMSGLSKIDPERFYTNLNNMIKGDQS